MRWFIVCAAVGALGALAAATANGEARALPIAERADAERAVERAVERAAGRADIRPWLAEQHAKHGEAFAQRAKRAMAAQTVARARSGEPYGMRPLGRNQAGAYEQLVDDFEGQVIDNLKWFWNIDSDLPPTRFGEYFWALSQCTSKPRKSGDVQSFWAIGGGREGNRKACGELYPNGAASEAALLLDLRYWDPQSTAQLELNYNIWLYVRNVQNTMTNVVEDGLFAVLCIPESGEPCRYQVVLQAQYGQSENWFDHPTVIDLKNACDYYDPARCFELAGREVIIKFVFKSERPVSGIEAPQAFPNGAFIDNVVLVSSNEPGPVLSPPTWTPIPGRTITVPTPGEPTASPTLDLETDTPGPSETPEPTETPGDSPTPADPPTDTPEPSATPTTGEVTDTATPEPTDTPRPTRTATTAAPPPPMRVYLPIGYKSGGTP